MNLILEKEVLYLILYTLKDCFLGLNTPERETVVEEVHTVEAPVQEAPLEEVVLHLEEVVALQLVETLDQALHYNTGFGFLHLEDMHNHIVWLLLV
jgi:hypothetical protein